jgi:hypothetical protein
VLVTSDEVPDPQDLAIRTAVSGEVMQSARTKEMLFGVAALVAYASQLMTLEPGDVILTGTPAGVGAARTPPRWLRDGDVVRWRSSGWGGCNYARFGDVADHQAAAIREPGASVRQFLISADICRRSRAGDRPSTLRTSSARAGKLAPSGRPRCSPRSCLTRPVPTQIRR